MGRVLHSVGLLGALFVFASGATAEPQCQGVGRDRLWSASEAQPAPVKDTSGRSGSWWWPKEFAANPDDSKLWGNGGVVYRRCCESNESNKSEETRQKPPTEPQPQRVGCMRPVLNFPLFEFDKATLRPEGKFEADKVVHCLKENSNNIVTIEGHTCDIGDADYNMRLGQRRAEAVKEYMVAEGADAARITTKSFGETKPCVPNDSPLNRKLNRRVVFIVTLFD